ncbi:hypothetical protein Tco_1270748, partial [Tanacetum coccineum]
ENSELDNESYVLYDHVMNPLAAQLERKPRRDHGTRRGRHYTSTSSALNQPSSSHLNADDDERTSHASTPSPIHVPPRLLNPQPLQIHPSLDITLSLSPITPLDHTHDTTSPPSPPQPQPPIISHSLFYNYHDYHGFETYVKSKDLDLWHVITNGDFQPIVQNPETKLDEVIPFEKQTDDLKRKLAKNNEAKMVIYNALPRKEYERIFMCNTAKEIWKTLLITHQGNSQVKDNKIDLLVQQYEQFVISEDESIDSAFARFNTIITSLKALDEGYSSKNYSQATTNFKADHVDAYDLDCDDEATTNAIFMENLSPLGSINDDMVESCYDSDILYEIVEIFL